MDLLFVLLYILYQSVFAIYRFIYKYLAVFGSWSPDYSVLFVLKITSYGSYDAPVTGHKNIFIVLLFIF